MCFNFLMVYPADGVSMCMDIGKVSPMPLPNVCVCTHTHTHTHVSHANVCVLYVFVCERECVRACVGGCVCVGLVQGRRAQVRDLLRWQDCRASESLWCPWYKFSKVLSISTLLFICISTNSQNLFLTLYMYIKYPIAH